LDLLTAVLLCLGAGAALAAATPPLLRALGVGLAPGAQALDVEASPATPHDAPASTIRASDSNPRFAPDDVEPRVTELERLYPDGMWPGRREEKPDDPIDRRTKAKSGHARAVLTVRDRADASARVAGSVPAGERLMVIREDGAWALVVHQGPDGITMGWATKSLVSVP
jgi:hypothetical protein